MKKYFLGAICLFLAINDLSAQITLEHTFLNKELSSVILFSANGTKIMVNDTGVAQVKLYNTDYSLWKTINLPAYSGYKFNAVSYVSDNLFNSDALVELLAQYYSATSVPHNKWQVINELGTLVADLDTSNYYTYIHDVDGIQ